MISTTYSRGFTLVETLVAITIIALAIVGPLYAVQQSLNISRVSRDQLVASALSQEAIEYVRSIRDGNYLYTLRTGTARSWLYGIDGTAGSTNCSTAPCVIDPTQNTVSRTITALRRSSIGLYNQEEGTVTPFTRTIRLTAVPGSTTEIVLTVTVTWSTNGLPYTFTLTERLHNWL